MSVGWRYLGKRVKRIALARKGGVCGRLRVWFSAWSSRRRGCVGRAIVVGRCVVLIAVMEQKLAPAPEGAPVILVATLWSVVRFDAEAQGLRGTFLGGEAWRHVCG